jgi:hypothetical protein
MMTVSVRWVVLRAPALPSARPSAPPASPARTSARTPARLSEYAVVVETRSYTQTSRRSSSVLTMLGVPSTWITSAPLMPTRISRCTLPTVMRSPSPSTAARCSGAVMQPASSQGSSANSTHFLIERSFPRAAEIGSGE